jgi:hypothetical protein
MSPGRKTRSLAHVVHSVHAVRSKQALLTGAKDRRSIAHVASGGQEYTVCASRSMQLNYAPLYVTQNEVHSIKRQDPGPPPGPTIRREIRSTTQSKRKKRSAPSVPRAQSAFDSKPPSPPAKSPVPRRFNQR